MRSYAFKGYENQGVGETVLTASWWLWAKTMYLDWLFVGDGSRGNQGNNVNWNAVLFTGFVGGLVFCLLVAIGVSLFVGDGIGKVGRDEKVKTT